MQEGFGLSGSSEKSRLMSITLVQKDSRGRVALGSVLGDDQYIVNVTSNGTVILEPAVIMSRQDLELRAQPEVLALVKERAKNHSAAIAGRPERPAQ